MRPPSRATLTLGEKPLIVADYSSVVLGRRRLLQTGMAAALPAPALAQVRGPILLGLTPVFVDSDLPLLRAIERELSTRAGTPVILVKRRTYGEIMALLLAGQVTAAWICGFPFVRHLDQLSLVAAPLYQGAPLYRSYLIAPSDTPGDTIAAFQGLPHAFSDPDSNSGWLVTRYLLAQAGTSPEAFFSRTFFAYGHRNVIRAVASGLASSGSVDGYVWDVLAEREPDLTRQTRIVRRSEPFGFPPIACLAAARQTAPVRGLAAALAGLPGDGAGRAVLAMLQLDGFAPADPSLYASIAQMYRSLPT